MSDVQHPHASLVVALFFFYCSSHSEESLLLALRTVSSGRTTISIAHRLSTIRHAGTVAVLAAGRVSEIGPFDELYANPDSQFMRLMNKQISGAGS